MGVFPSGIVVVTADADDPVGMTCQSFLSLSLDPPYIAFAPSITSVSYPRIREHGSFCCNVLAAGQHDLSSNFARRADDKWAGVDWTPSPGGNPVLSGVLGWIDCRLEAEYTIGDHHLVVGRVLDFHSERQAREALLYHRGGYALSAGSPSANSGDS
ncbi:hypothetical protein AWB99_10745 [Mycolicibacterium confluentis]|nr:flavin reductase family protein [Mycolicibacterium confluentis]ORV32310.1 hypothetical protein AWB99_10745 [Mycolicibacterium confluentis]